MKLTVGRIVRSHGVRGDVICEVRTDEPEQRFADGSVLHTDPSRFGPVTVGSARWYQGRMLLSIDGVADRDAAEALRGVALTVDSHDVELPEDPDEFRDLDLIGLSVVEESGEVIGTVARIEHAPAHDLLVVDREGAKPALIPFIQAMVPTVDTDNRRIVVTLPEGLLDL